ncbi:MAG: cation diffusion facilitator family transporter [Bdellovibrionota bacterium]
MAATDGSTKVIVYALFANLGIAIIKFIGALFTKSASLLAESIHSLADCTNQVFLLIGAKKSKKPADEKHPLGYGRESFFWSFLVAILLFSMGGIFAIYEGVHKLTAIDQELKMPFIGVAILVVSILLEAGSFWACVKEVKKINTHPNLWQWFKKSTASDLVVIFMEDLAALLGLILALMFLIIAILTGNPMWDAIGSVVIGMLLVIVSFLLAYEVKSLLVGEAPTENYKDAIAKLFLSHDSEMKILKFIALVTGNNQIMVSLKVHPGSCTSCAVLIDTINSVEVKIKQQFPEIKWIFIEPDHVD